MAEDKLDRKGEEELGQQLPKTYSMSFLMRSNWGWVGAGKGKQYKSGPACADGGNQGEEVSVSLRAAEGKGKGRDCWEGRLV